MITSARKLAVVGAAAVAVAAGAVTAPAMAAAPAGTFEVDYDASGTTHLAKPNTDLKLGPTTLTSYISDSGDGSITGSLPLPPTNASFKIIGFVPVSATVNFIPVSLNGKLSSDTPLTVSATAKYIIRLTNVKAAGLPTFQGSSCQTTSPVAIPVATPKGQTFDLTDGGNLAGTYTIGSFANCGLTTALINAVVPGSGNTVNFKVSNGRFVG